MEKCCKDELDNTTRIKDSYGNISKLEKLTAEREGLIQNLKQRIFPFLSHRQNYYQLINGRCLLSEDTSKITMFATTPFDRQPSM